MNTLDLQSVMQKWADQNGSKLQINSTNKRGHESAFSFVWTKPLWVLGEDGWEMEEDMGEPVLVSVLDDGEMFIGPDVADEDEGYSMVLLMDEASEVGDALELLWNAREELFQDPMPADLEGTRLAELRDWFEMCFTPDEDEHSCCGEEACDCEDDGDSCVDSRMITIACDAEPKANVHCPVCGTLAAPKSCSHLLFLHENGDSLSFISAQFSKELEEHSISIEEFTADPEQLRYDESWDSDYLFFDVLHVEKDEESGSDTFVGFHCKW